MTKKAEKSNKPLQPSLDIAGVSGGLSKITFSYKHPTGRKIGKLEYDENMLILRYKGGYIINP